MGAEVPYKIRILRLVEEVIEVYAVTESDALQEATNGPDVAMVLGVIEEGK